MRIVFALLPFYILFSACIVLLAGWWGVMRLRRAAGTWRLRYFAYPRTWLKYLHTNVPLYTRLPWELRAPFQDKVLQFVDGKNFRPCGTLDEATDEMRVTIAAHACLLLLNENAEVCYPEVLTVQIHRAGTTNEELDAAARLPGAVIMLWDAAKKRATDPRDTGNESLTRIALELGWETRGMPALPDTLLLTAWARQRSAEFVPRYPGELEKAAAGDAADVFAVATEMFLATPAVLQQRHAVLYNNLRQFYKVDPARWALKQ